MYMRNVCLLGYTVCKVYLNFYLYKSKVHSVQRPGSLQVFKILRFNMLRLAETQTRMLTTFSGKSWCTLNRLLCHWSLIKVWDFVDLYGQRHSNIQQNQGGLDKLSKVTMKIDISFVYFNYFFVVVFLCYFAKDLCFKSVLYYSILCSCFLPRLVINILHKVQRSPLHFIKPLECWYYQCHLSFFTLNHLCCFFNLCHFLHFSFVSLISSSLVLFVRFLCFDNFIVFTYIDVKKVGIHVSGATYLCKLLPHFVRVGFLTSRRLRTAF